MSVEYLREFVVLAEKLNFTSASKALNITQPALSNHIKSLEREFGFVLLERSSSEGARLTKAGRVVYERSERLVRAYEEMVEDARKVQREVSGRIVLQLPRSELCGELIMAVKDFMAHHPNIDVDIRPWCQADSLDEIEAGRIDCGYFGPLVGEHSSLDECGTCRLVPLVQSEFLLFVPKDGPYAKAGSFPVEDLSRFNIAVQANQKNRTWSALVRNVRQPVGRAEHRAALRRLGRGHVPELPRAERRCPGERELAGNAVVLDARRSRAGSPRSPGEGRRACRDARAGQERGARLLRRASRATLVGSGRCRSSGAALG